MAWESILTRFLAQPEVFAARVARCRPQIKIVRHFVCALLGEVEGATLDKHLALSTEISLPLRNFPFRSLSGLSASFSVTEGPGIAHHLRVSQPPRFFLSSGDRVGMVEKPVPSQFR